MCFFSSKASHIMYTHTHIYIYIVIYRYIFLYIYIYVYIYMCVCVCQVIRSQWTIPCLARLGSRGGWLRWYQEQFLGAHCHRIPPRPAYEMAHLTGETSHQLLGRSIVEYPLVNAYITMENHHVQWENSLYMVMFNSYVKLPEGNGNIEKQIKRM